MQSGILHRDTVVEARVNVLVFAHRPCLRSASTAHGILAVNTCSKAEAVGIKEVFKNRPRAMATGTK